MGITTDKYFENIYSVIFSPKAFFEQEDLAVSTRLAAATIVLITTIAKLSSAIFDGSILQPAFILGLIFAILGSLFIWFFTALFFEYIAKIFTDKGNLTKILFFTSFAPVPYIFFAPLNLLKDFGTIGYFIGAYAEFFLYLWIIFLYALALRAVYRITLSRSFMLILLPFFASFFALYWMIGFILKICYIFSI